MDWDNVRVFLAVARGGQFVAAARRLRLDHATVSRRIAALEAALGAKLFERRTTGAAPARADDAPFTIGIMNDQSGPYADLAGPGSAEMARMAIEDFGGAVLGRKIALLVADHPN